MSFLQLKSLSKSFDDAPVLRGVDLSIDRGGFVAVVGPSGCGKSTLLRILAGLEAQDDGEVWIGGDRVDALPAKARDIAMVFQSYALYPHMTVAQNLALPLVMRDLTRIGRLPLMHRLDRRVAATRREIQTTVERTAAAMGLAGLLARKPKQLSGGQRQRVALGRALVRQPRLFLLDEPLSNLDAALRATTRTEIVDLQRRLGITTVYVTHDQTEAMTMAERIAVMMDGDVVQIGRPREIYERPSDVRVAQFIGMPKMALLPGRVENGVVRLASDVAVARTAEADQPAGIGFRAEDIRLEPAPTALPLSGPIRHIEYLGSEVLVHVALPGLPDTPTLVARISAQEAEAFSDNVECGIAPNLEKAHVFGQSGRRLTTAPLAPAYPNDAAVVETAAS